MKVFFTASRQGKQYFDYYYQQINTLLNDEGYENTNHDFLTANKPETDEKLKKNDYVMQNKVLSDRIHEADLCIFECSIKSTTVGFLIQKSLDLEKPVIALFLENHQPAFLLGLENEKFQLLEYNKNNLTKLLKEAIIKAGYLTDKRFNFFVSSNMLAYLNSVSKKLGITKSTFIRNLIEEYKKNHA